MTYVRYLYSINCPTIIFLPSMLLFILWRDTTSELWTPVQFPLHCYYRLLLLALFTFLHTITFYNWICSILCLQQTDEIDNLIVSWGQSSWLCCVQVPRCCWWKASRRQYSSGAAVRSVGKLASITFWSLALSYWFDKPWFHNWGKLAAVLLISSSWGSQLGALTPHHQAFFWCRCRGERRFLQGESLTLSLLLCFCFALFYFYLHHFIKNTKNLASLIVVTFICLL
jgi:hypothetical protein